MVDRDRSASEGLDGRDAFAREGIHTSSMDAEKVSETHDDLVGSLARDMETGSGSLPGTNMSVAEGVVSPAGDPAAAPSSTNAAQLEDAADPGTADLDVAPLSDEERVEIRKRNALIRAWDRALSDMRQRSYEGKLTTPARWRKLSLAPAGWNAKAFEESLIDYIESHDHADDSPALNEPPAPAPLDVQLEGVEHTDDDPLPELSVADVVMLFGKKTVYLYSKPLLSHSFAHALFMTSEDDDLSTFIDMVRTESRLYPRPVSRDTFMNPPYLWAPSKTAQVFDQVVADGSFPDIHEVRASNGVVNYYSSLYLSDAQAQALAEWYEVEKPQNP